MKTTNFIVLITLVAIWSCTTSADKYTVQTNTVNSKLDTVLQKDSNDNFLDLFSGIALDIFHVYSPAYDKPDNKFQGKQIDKRFYPLFAFDEALTYNLTDNRGSKDNIYACYKLKLSDNKTGLIVRTPSQYDITAIDLFIWDNAKKEIESRINLSDGFGDEGWYFIQDAWITDLNKDGKLDIIKRKKDHNMDVDDTTNVSNTDSVFILLGNGDEFQKSQLRIDTSKFHLKYWDN